MTSSQLSFAFCESTTQQLENLLSLDSRMICNNPTYDFGLLPASEEVYCALSSLPVAGDLSCLFDLDRFVNLVNDDRVVRAVLPDMNIEQQAIVVSSSGLILSRCPDQPIGGDIPLFVFKDWDDHVICTLRTWRRYAPVATPAPAVPAPCVERRPRETEDFTRVLASWPSVGPLVGRPGNSRYVRPTYAPFRLLLADGRTMSLKVPREFNAKDFSEILKAAEWSCSSVLVAMARRLHAFEQMPANEGRLIIEQAGIDTCCWLAGFVPELPTLRDYADLADSYRNDDFATSFLATITYMASANTTAINMDDCPQAPGWEPDLLAGYNGCLDDVRKEIVRHIHSVTPSRIRNSRITATAQLPMEARQFVLDFRALRLGSDIHPVVQAAKDKLVEWSQSDRSQRGNHEAVIRLAILIEAWNALQLNVPFSIHWRPGSRIPFPRLLAVRQRALA